MKEVNASIIRERTQTLARTLLLVALAAVVACDPGMTIRQTNSHVESENTAFPKISVEVKPTHQLIGERWYDPQVKVTNSSEFSITISSIELVAGGVTYENRPHDSKYYPLNLPARGTAPLAGCGKTR
jgi:hypothetical protein